MMGRIAAVWRWVARHGAWWVAIVLVVVVVGNFVFHPLADPSVVPAPLAHGVGILGSILTILSLAYSLKKRVRRIKFGRTRTWLSWHVALGLVGPVLVELHAGPSFYGVGGLARVAMWLVVLSGIAGRYLYSLIPAAMLDGVEASAALLDEGRLLDQDIEQLMQRRLQVARQAQDVGLLPMLAEQKMARVSAGVFTNWTAFRDMVRFNYFYLKDLAATQREIKRIYREERASMSELYERLFQRISLERRMAWLMVADEAIRLWRLIHVPPCVLLVILTLAHLWTMLYY